MTCEYMRSILETSMGDTLSLSRSHPDENVQALTNCNQDGCPVSIYVIARNKKVIEGGTFKGDVCKNSGQKSEVVLKEIEQDIVKSSKK